MPDINMANRQCCDVDIRDYVTKKPFLDADFCNTTTAGFNGDAVWATKKGAKCIAFDNPLDGSITLEFQVHPFKVYALLSDGEIETTAIVAWRETIVADGTNKISVTKGVPDSGSVFVFANGDFGGTALEVTVSGKNITGTFTEGASYDVAYLETRTKGVKKISFNNKKVPKYYWVQMSTVDKNENGELVPLRMTCYKGKPVRNLDLSFASEGDPATIKIELTCLEDANGDVLDMIEITDEDEA